MSSLFNQELLLSETVEGHSFYGGYRLKTITHANITAIPAASIALKVTEYQYVVYDAVPTVHYIVSAYGVDYNGELHSFPLSKAISARKEENHVVIALDLVGTLLAHPQYNRFVAAVTIKIAQIGFPEVYVLDARFDDEMTFREQTHFI